MRKKTKEEYNNQLHTIHPHINLISDYLGTHEQSSFECLIDGCVWQSTPRNVLRDKLACPCCKSKAQSLRQTWSNEYYVSKLSEVTKDIISLEPYITSYTKIKHKCKKCNYEWMIEPNEVLSRHICPNCNKTLGEAKISDYLSENDILYQPQKTFDGLKYKKTLFYDFYLPEFNMLIEYDGEFHCSPIFSEEAFEHEKKRDKLKTKYAMENNIALLRIPYWEYDNINNILDEKLRRI